MKTYEEWNKSGKNFSEFVKAGDEIDEKMYYYFLEVLPPAKMMSKGFLVGEPYSHDQNGNPLYDSFYNISDQRYYYEGLKTIKEFCDLHKK